MGNGTKTALGLVAFSIRGSPALLACQFQHPIDGDRQYSGDRILPSRRTDRSFGRSMTQSAKREDGDPISRPNAAKQEAHSSLAVNRSANVKMELATLSAPRTQSAFAYDIRQFRSRRLDIESYPSRRTITRPNRRSASSFRHSGLPECRGEILMLHGLEGSSDAGYMRSMSQLRVRERLRGSSDEHAKLRGYGPVLQNDVSCRDYIGHSGYPPQVASHRQRALCFSSATLLEAM